MCIPVKPENDAPAAAKQADQSHAPLQLHWSAGSVRALPCEPACASHGIKEGAAFGMHMERYTLEGCDMGMHTRRLTGSRPACHAAWLPCPLPAGGADPCAVAAAPCHH